MDTEKYILAAERKQPVTYSNDVRPDTDNLAPGDVRNDRSARRLAKKTALIEAAMDNLLRTRRAR